MPANPRAILCHLHRLTSPAPTDAVLLSRWTGQRDEDAFATLVSRHGAMVLGIARRVTGDVQHAEDVFQATFLVLARQAERLRRPEALASFLYGVALRLARRSRGIAQRRSPQSSLEDSEPIDPQPHPLDVLSGRELLTLIDEEVTHLPEVYRLPVLLCVMQGRPVEEAAQVLGWGTGSVRGRLARGRERLRQRLARRGLTLSVGTVALLAPAVLPQRLQAEAIRNLCDAPPTISALASAAAPSLPRRLIGLGLLLAVIGLGAGLSFLRAPAEPQTPAPAKPPAPEKAKEEPRRDRHGDPLPPGAVARLGTLRFRAPDEIHGFAMAPDGKTLVVSSGVDLFLLDAASGKRLRRLTPHFREGREEIVVFSPDGKRLAARSAAIRDGAAPKGVLRVWDLAGEEKPTTYDAEHTVWVGWSSSGKPLAVCLENEALRLRELSVDRSKRFECKDLRQPELSSLVACAYAPAGKALAVADQQNVVHVWDSDTGRERYTVQPEGGFVRTLAFAPDGKTLASLTGGAVQLWDSITGKFLRAVATDRMNFNTAAFTPDGKTLATVGWRDVRFWDVATGREQSRTQEKCLFAPAIAFSADGRTMVTADHNGPAVRVWDVATGKQQPQPAGHRASPHGTAFSPDVRRLATGGSLDGTIYIWDLRTGESMVRVSRPGQWVRDVAYSADGSSLFSTWTDENLWVNNASTGEQQHVLKLEDPERPDTRQSAISMYPSADGKTLIAFSHYQPKDDNGGQQYDETLITGWDTSTRKQLFRRRRPGQDFWVALSPDARVLAAPHPANATEDKEAPGKGPMRLEDVATGEVLLTFPSLGGQTWPLAFSPDGRFLASHNVDWKRKDRPGDPGAATGRALHVWEAATASEVLVLPEGGGDRCAFSPDGRLLAMVAPTQELLVWDLARGCEWRRFKGFDSYLTHLAFAPDGRCLISGLRDSTFLIWDVGTPEAIAGKLGSEGMAKAWADLAGTDGPRALRAHWALATAAEEALPLLKKHLRPARSADAEQVKRLLKDLDSEQFEVREKAQAALAELGDLAEPALRETLKKKPSLDVHRRVQAVLDGLCKPVTKPEALQTLRAVGVLETIGTPAALQILKELASGAAEARLTREAKASLSRLDRKTPAK